MSELRARVISQEKGLYQISSGTEVKQASVSGKFRYEAQTVSDYPAVGDYVLAEWQEAGSPAIIRSLLPRKSCFLRKAAGSAKQEQVVAANIDTVFLCMSLNQNFNLRRLERYLSIAYDSGAEPVVVLTKADLCQDPEGKIAQVRTAAPGAEILTVSSLTGDTDAVLPYILPGRTVAFLGSSGVGKSTLIKALAGLIRPDSGKILWNGRPLHDTPGEIAYLPQRSDVDWSFPITVRALVEMGRYPSLGLWKKFGRHDRDIVEKSLHALGMESLADRQISELSGGQQQRAFLARALAQEAHVLLLDEPFTGLDAPASQSLGRLLDSLAAEGRLVIASHHDLNTAADIFDTILLMNRELAAFGPPKEVLSPARIREIYGMDPQPETQAS